MRLVAQGCRDLDLIATWPAGQPLLALLGSGRYGVVATAFAEIPFADARAFRFSGPAPAPGAPPFGPGIVGLVGYDSQGPNRAFRVRQALVLDRQTKALWLAGDEAPPPSPWTLPPAALADLIRGSRGDTETPAAPVGSVGLRLRPLESDESYLAKARHVLEEIRAGRYYQLNLLRYFAVDGAAPGRAWILARMASHGGAFAALVDLPGLSLASFSPERFVSVSGETIETFPVKGTAPRHAEPDADRAAAAQLVRSAKDQAELAMIVDLMRNDLGIVARSGTVTVPETRLLTSHANVHHLSARVRATLLPGTTLGAILDAVCPGGSITGAPKREVMTAIGALEGRPRGYFMGNLFFLGDGGYFDSSILIRTLIRSEASGLYELAAGSGLVVGSDPELERAEIAAKARVVGAIINPSLAVTASDL